jgi:hypothetical protein
MSRAYRKENALNAICPYFTAFPLEYPMGILAKHAQTRLVVLDPFCGRGTTLFAARSFGLASWGIDASPVAVAIAKAKLADFKAQAVIDLAERILRNVEPRLVPESDFFRIAYHAQTLRDICALRQGLLQLGEETDATVILRAAILGCLHGPLPKNLKNAGYFSNQMLRTFAPKPDYAVRFWRDRMLMPPKIDVLTVLRRKLERMANTALAPSCPVSNVLFSDARLPDAFSFMTQAPDLVITSPPYYGMRTYVQDQWLRHWFLGGLDHVDYSAQPQLDHGSQESFIESLGAVWKNIAQGARSKANLDLYVRFGVIPSAKVDAKTVFLDSLAASRVHWKVISIIDAKPVGARRRQAIQMKAQSSMETEYDFHVAPQ